MNRAFRCNRLPVEQKFKCERDAVCNGSFIMNATRMVVVLCARTHTRQIAFVTTHANVSSYLMANCDHK